VPVPVHTSTASPEIVVPVSSTFIGESSFSINQNMSEQISNPVATHLSLSGPVLASTRQMVMKVTHSSNSMASPSQKFRKQNSSISLGSEGGGGNVVVVVVVGGAVVVVGVVVVDVVVVVVVVVVGGGAVVGGVVVVVGGAVVVVVVGGGAVVVVVVGGGASTLAKQQFGQSSVVFLRRAAPPSPSSVPSTPSTLERDWQSIPIPMFLLLGSVELGSGQLGFGVLLLAMSTLEPCLTSTPSPPFPLMSLEAVSATETSETKIPLVALSRMAFPRILASEFRLSAMPLCPLLLIVFRFSGVQEVPMRAELCSFTAIPFPP